nr:hypothetical protein [Tanacetum cinerariifolium]
MGDKGHLRVDVANLARAEPDKCSEEADMSKDTSCPESLEEFRRSWYVEGQTSKILILSPLGYIWWEGEGTSDHENMPALQKEKG